MEGPRLSRLIYKATQGVNLKEFLGGGLYTARGGWDCSQKGGGDKEITEEGNPENVKANRNPDR